MTLKELLVKVGFNVEGKEKLKGVEAQLEGIKSKLELLTALELGKAVYELAERFAHFAEEIHVAAQSAGITAEVFQKLAFAAGQNAVSQDEMASAMARLSRHLYDARKGGAEAAKVFADAGFSAEQVQGFKTGSDVMLALSDRFKTIQDPIKKQAIAMELMGRGSINMVGFLSKGSAAIKGMGDEAQRLGIVLSDQQVEALVEVEHSLQKLWGTIKGFSATIASLFGPSITFLIDKFLKFYELNHKLVQEGVEAWAHKFAYAMGFIYGLVEDVVKVFLRFVDSHRTLAKAVFATITSFVGLVSIAVVAIKVLSFFHDTIEQGAKLWSFVGKVWEFVKALREWSVVTRIASAATWLWNAAMGVLTAEVAFLEAPIWLVIAAVGLLVIAVHDLYTVLFGSGKFEDTWISKAFGAMKGAAGWFGNILGVGADKIKGAQEGLKGMDFSTESLLKVANAGDLSALKSSPGAIAPTASGANNNYSVNAPITVNVPAGTDHKQVSKSVKEGVQQHLDRVYRETSRSLRPTEAY